MRFKGGCEKIGVENILIGSTKSAICETIVKYVEFNNKVTYG